MLRGRKKGPAIDGVRVLAQARGQPLSWLRFAATRNANNLALAPNRQSGMDSSSDERKHQNYCLGSDLLLLWADSPVASQAASPFAWQNAPDPHHLLSSCVTGAGFLPPRSNSSPTTLNTTQHTTQSPPAALCVLCDKCLTYVFLYHRCNILQIQLSQIHMTLMSLSIGVCQLDVHDPSRPWRAATGLFQRHAYMCNTQTVQCKTDTLAKF